MMPIVSCEKANVAKKTGDERKDRDDVFDDLHFATLSKGSQPPSTAVLFKLDTIFSLGFSLKQADKTIANRLFHHETFFEEIG